MMAMANGHHLTLNLYTKSGRNSSMIPAALRYLYTVAVTAKPRLLKPNRLRTIQWAGVAVASRFAKKVSIACAIDPAVLVRQLSDTRCSRSPLFVT